VVYEELKSSHWGFNYKSELVIGIVVETFLRENIMERLLCRQNCLPYNKHKLKIESR